MQNNLNSENKSSSFSIILIPFLLVIPKVNLISIPSILYGFLWVSKVSMGCSLTPHRSQAISTVLYRFRFRRMPEDFFGSSWISSLDFRGFIFDFFEFRYGPLVLYK